MANPPTKKAKHICLRAALFFNSSWGAEKMTRLRGRLSCCRPCEPEPGNTGGGKQSENTNHSIE
jgi:hypothetical protein